MAHRLLVGWLVGCLCLLGAAPVRADAKKANQLARDALAAYEEARWEEAFAAFDEANELAHSPVFVLYQARCRRAQGRLLAAAELYRSVSREELAASAPAPFRKAQDEARAELAALGSEIPKLTVEATDLDGAAVRVGDEPYRGEPLRLDPGSYEVVAERDGVVVASVIVDLAKGQVKTVSLAPADEPPEPAAPPPPGDEGVATTTVLGATALGLGGAARVAGGVTGGLALAGASDAKDACGPTGICPGGDSSEKDDATTLAHVSTATLIAGGVLAATGVVLLVIDAGDDTEVGLGPLSLSFTARF